MARMHARKRGKSGSKKPIKKITPDWLIYDKDEVEEIIMKLAKESYTDSMIGILLRDQYGVPDVSQLGLKISEITERSNKKEIPEDLMFLLRRVVRLYKHLDANHKDGKNKHGLQLLESKIRRLVKYYKKTGKLPDDWSYNRERAELLVK